MNSDELAKDVLGAEELLEIQQERKVSGERGLEPHEDLLNLTQLSYLITLRCQIVMGKIKSGILNLFILGHNKLMSLSYALSITFG